MTRQWFAKFVGSTWNGSGELWLDPTGYEVERYDCTMRFAEDALRYTWSQAGVAQTGSYVFDEVGATWTDSWHQPEDAKCTDVPGAWGLFTVAYTYEAPPGPPWGWRAKLSQRPDGDLVLQMTNITPWGEEGRAVRMTFSRAD